MLRRVISCSPGSLQLAVTHVGQFLKCISSGNKTLNLFGWKQLVVSQIQMPTRVLSANLLDECWIDFFFYFLFLGKLWGWRRENCWFCFCKSFVSSLTRGRREGWAECPVALLQAGAGRAEDASFLVLLVPWEPVPKHRVTAAFRSYARRPSLSTYAFAVGTVLWYNNSLIKEKYIFKKKILNNF